MMGWHVHGVHSATAHHFSRLWPVTLDNIPIFIMSLSNLINISKTSRCFYLRQDKPTIKHKIITIINSYSYQIYLNLRYYFNKKDIKYDMIFHSNTPEHSHTGENSFCGPFSIRLSRLFVGNVAQAWKIDQVMDLENLNPTWAKRKKKSLMVRLSFGLDSAWAGTSITLFSRSTLFGSGEHEAVPIH